MLIMVGSKGRAGEGSKLFILLGGVCDLRVIMMMFMVLMGFMLTRFMLMKVMLMRVMLMRSMLMGFMVVLVLVVLVLVVLVVLRRRLLLKMLLRMVIILRLGRRCRSLMVLTVGGTGALPRGLAHWHDVGDSRLIFALDKILHKFWYVRFRFRVGYNGGDDWGLHKPLVRSPEECRLVQIVNLHVFCNACRRLPTTCPPSRSMASFLLNRLGRGSRASPRR